MSRPASHRFYLADLVLAALMCGLVLALFTSARNQVEGGLVIVLISVVASIWSLFHARRKAPTCEECGRRFVEPEKPSVSPSACPHCGREQRAEERSIRRWKQARRNLLALVMVFVAVLAVLLTGIAGGLGVGLVLFGELIAAVGTLSGLLLWVVAAIYVSSLKSPRERPCETCGEIIPLERPAGPTICPQCRVRHLRPDEVKKQRARDQRLGLGSLILLAILAAFLLPRPGGSGSVVGWWIGFLLTVLGILAAIFGVLVAWAMLLQLRRRRQFTSESGSLALARKAAGRDGDVVREGPWTIWYTGPDDPAPMIRESMAEACRRFAALTGAAEVSELALRFFVFHDRAAFMRFHQKIVAGIDLTSLDGVQLGVPYHLITLCTASAPCRITDPERTLRMLAAYALLESAWGPKPPPWLQSGLSRSVIAADTPDERARLNRKVAASLAIEAALSTEIFAMTHKDLFRLMRGPKEPAKLQKLAQFHHQSRSIVEYLCGELAPRDMRSALGAFLRDARSKTEPEASFRHHFGQGFGPLLDGWRQWVLEQGIGAYEPPPDRIRDALLERILPAIRDRRAKRGDRLVAIGEWANAGYVIGADALIDLLRDPGDLPKEQVVWALCMVSGMAWGDEPDRWQAWWDELPTSWVEQPGATTMPSGAEPAGPVAAVAGGPARVDPADA
jgi:membrane protein implicated in regulation of membrane protease activity